MHTQMCSLMPVLFKWALQLMSVWIALDTVLHGLGTDTVHTQLLLELSQVFITHRKIVHHRANIDVGTFNQVIARITPFLSGARESVSAVVRLFPGVYEVV